MSKRPNRITRKDVAQAAGVSTAVVSYVINNGPRPVAEPTRQRVLKAIDQLGYRVNALARSVKLGITSTVGIIAPDIEEPFHSWVVQELDQRFRREGISILLSNVHRDPIEEWKVANELISRGVDFLVVLMSSLSDEQWVDAKFPIPVAMMDRPRALLGALTVGPDFTDGGRKCTEHLISHGRMQIVPVFGEFNTSNENDRHAGYVQALKTAGLQPLTPIICEWKMQGGYQAGLEYLRRGGTDFADGIFCFSDSIAIGLLRALRENNVRIPKDVAVIGFDGISLDAYTSPALSTAAQPIQEMVDYIVQTLLDESLSLDTLELRKFPVQLKPAASCGC